MLNNHYSPKLGVRAFFNFIEIYFNITQFEFGKNANSFYVCVGLYPYA